jgi:hypothetical protein
MRSPRFSPLFAILAFCFAFAPLAFAQTIPANTSISVRLDQTISSRKATPNQRVKAQLASDLVVNGEILLPKGAAAVICVEQVQPGGDSTKPAALWLRLDAIAADGRAYPVTARFVGQQLAPSTEATATAKLVSTSDNADDPDAPPQVTYQSATVLTFTLTSPVQLR